MAKRFSRRSRALAVGLLMLTLLGGFAGTCVGGDTPEVQKPVNESKLRYEEFLRQIGVLGSTGQIAAPWIVAPEDGSDVSGEIEVKGWSVVAKDVAGTLPGTATTVRVFVIPRAVYDKNPGVLAGYEVTSASRAAVVSDETREWSLSLSDADFAPGENVIIAKTHMSAFGVLESPLARVNVTDENGTAPDFRLSSGAPPKETLRLVCVMAQPKGFPFASGDEQELRNLITSTEDYWRQVSHGEAIVGSVEWLTNDGKGYPVTDWGDSFQSWEYIQEVLKTPDVAKALDEVADGPLSVIVFIPSGADKKTPTLFKGGYLGWSQSWQDFDEKTVPAIAGKGLEKRRGSFIHLPVWSVGTVLHEISHGLGTTRRKAELGIDVAALPDLYPNDSSYYGVDEYSNITQDTYGQYFLMSKSGAGNTLSGFSQWWLEWVEWQSIERSTPSATLVAPTLSTGADPPVTVPRITYSESDGRKAYVVLDGRAVDQEFDSNWWRKVQGVAPDAISSDGWLGDGVIVYRIRERIGKENDVRPGWPRSANYLARLDNSHPSWEDPGRLYRLELKNGFSSSAQSTEVEYTSLTSVPSLKDSAGTVTSGALLRPSLTNMPLITPISDRSEETSGATLPQPDLDLHAYLPDGTHIGMNYETGVYEVPVAGAITSGDMAMDDEWILLPEDIAATARFEISSHDTEDFLKTLPKEVEAPALDIDYEMSSVAYSDTDAAVVSGAAEKGTLAPGAAANTRLSGDPRKPKLAPLAPGSGGPTGLSAVDPILWELGGSGLLIMVGLIVLLWPRKR